MCLVVTVVTTSRRPPRSSSLRKFQVKFQTKPNQQANNPKPQTICSKSWRHRLPMDIATMYRSAHPFIDPLSDEAWPSSTSFSELFRKPGRSLVVTPNWLSDIFYRLTIVTVWRFSPNIRSNTTCIKNLLMSSSANSWPSPTRCGWCFTDLP